MDDRERIQLISKRLDANEYFIHPLSDASTKDDIDFLLSLIKKKDDRIALLERKGEVLGQQVQELTTEIENVKGDFGNFR